MVKFLSADRSCRLSIFLSLLSAVATLFAFAPHAQAQSPVISEFVAANDSGLLDADDEASDWIEIYNPTDGPIRLQGWALSDDSANPKKWIFPDVTLNARSFLVVFASGKNRTNDLSDLHANFSLSRDGEYLALVKPDGSTAFEITPAAQVTDVSYGVAMDVQRDTLIAERASARLLLPTTALAANVWTQPDFDDTAWQTATLAVGYDRIPVGATDPNEPPSAVVDVTSPGDLVIPTSSNSPSNETAPLAIDNTTATKYLNFDRFNTGFTVTPSVGASIVTALRISSANDAPERDPTSFTLSGSNDGVTYTEIANLPIPVYSSRFEAQLVSFENKVSYLHYRLIFPTIRSDSANSMQISEVEFLGTVGSSAPSLRERIVTNIESAMHNKHSSALLRMPFNLDALPNIENLRLHLWYEDGFVAWLNGVEIARANAPANPAFNSTAVTNRFRRDAVDELIVNLTSRANLLRVGKNVLAIQGLNSAVSSDEFLIDAQLENTRLTLANRSYFETPTPGSANGLPLAGLVSPVLSSQPRGIQNAPFNMTLSCATPGVTIKYTIDSSTPNETNGVVYSGPTYVDKSFVIRAVAMRDGWRNSPVETFTYLFLNDVVRQTRASALALGFPASWNGQAADYGLDPRVVGPNDSFGGKYAATLKSNLLAIPSMSLVMDMPDMFGPNGIYSNPNSRGELWERPVSFEIFYPNQVGGGQWNAGVRIQGGAFRRFDLSLKKSFRVVFREKYGPAKLEYPLFGPGAATEFQNIVLRANSNDAWPWGGGNALYVRDAFAMESIREMGQVSSHIEYVHLYINGQYWGLYNPVERPDAAFSSTYFGGDRDTWDALNQDSAPDGNYDAWNRMMQALSGADIASPALYQRIQGNNPDGTRNPAYEHLLDVENYINYLIMNFYTGNSDWPHRNWWAGRDRNDGDGFKFYPWDTETSMGFSGVNQNNLGVTDGAARPYARIRQNPEFKLQFADQVHKHFFNGGVFYVNSNSPAWNPAQPQNNRPAARMAALADHVRSPIVGESARWGDQLRSTPFTRDEHWEPTLQGLLRDYFPRRSAIVLEQFRVAGFYPRTVAPSMSQRGGKVAKGFSLTLAAPAGQIYYTINGGDPRATNRSTRYTGPVTLTDYAHVQARVWSGTEWSALDEATFEIGTPKLVVSELNYHPGDPTAAEIAAGFTSDNNFEFIELTNAGDGSLNLADIEFVTGITFRFADSAVDRLAPGAHLLLVSNPAAMQFRYGAGLPIAGLFTGRLDNSGERIAAVDGAQQTVLDFVYRRSLPWPTAADGSGATLELVNVAGDMNDPANWQASSGNGSPGNATPISVTINQVALAANELTFAFQARPGATFVVSASTSLTGQSWTVAAQGVVPANGVVQQQIPATGSAQYFRVRVD